MTEQTYLARVSIPEAWAAQGRCIWCGQQSLGILHPGNSPDLIFCNDCQFTYELEKSGYMIRVCELPEGMPGQYEQTWIPISTILELAKPLHITPKKQRMHVPLVEFTYKGGEAVQDSQSNSLMQHFKEEESAQLVELTDEEIRHQVLELHALGNSSRKIQEILFTRNQVSPERIQQAIEPILTKNKIRQKQGLQKAAIFFAVVIITLVIIGFVLRWLFPLITQIIQEQLRLFGFSV